MCNNGFGGGNCCWIIILLIIVWCCCGNNSWGGSGCGCAAVTLCAEILPRMMAGTWKRVLFLPTGALLSTISYNEGQSIPAICHGVILERMDRKERK